LTRTFIIAEVGNNHNGCLQRAERLIRFAADAGVDAVKFQLRNFDELYRKQNNDVEDLGVEYTKEILKKYELDREFHVNLKEMCHYCGVEYMCTPWDISSLSFLLGIGVERIKIASADFDNLFLIDAVIAAKKEIYLSTGMSSTSEIEYISNYLKVKGANFSLLHCNSTYPAPFQDIELNFIRQLKKFSQHVGYSGHERGVSVSVAAVALGATIIERHITEDKELEGPDHQASLTPDEFRQMVSMIREVEVALGEPDIVNRKLSQGVKLNRENLGKSLVYAKDFVAGETLCENSFVTKSPGQGLSPLLVDELHGKVLTANVSKHDFVFWSDFEENRKQKFFEDSKLKWGIPVRPHDFLRLHHQFDARTYEFHISYSDLARTLPNEDWGILSEKNVVVHAPELFENSELLDLCAENVEVRERSVVNLQRVVDFTSKVSEKASYHKRIGIVANVGGFSIHAFKEKGERRKLYERVLESLNKIDWRNTQILIQNMAPFPWHFGGQRYQNIFGHSNEIVNFCKESGTKICLDTAHLSMHCVHHKLDFKTEFNILLPFTAHFHMSDAAGLNGEGVDLGQGDIDFDFVINAVNEHQTFIVETWQGHKAHGAGFARDLKILNEAR
jgi:sialic acid synthase SpsE/endonuclease IV